MHLAHKRPADPIAGARALATSVAGSSGYQFLLRL